MTSRPCAHLERLLPSVTDKRLILADLSNCSMDVFQAYRPSFSVDEFTGLMRGFGFVDDWDLELLVAKYYYGMSYRRIAAEGSYVSFSTVRWRLKTLHKQLKERGFKPRTRK